MKHRTHELLVGVRIGTGRLGIAALTVVLAAAPLFAFESNAKPVPAAAQEAQIEVQIAPENLVVDRVEAARRHLADVDPVSGFPRGLNHEVARDAAAGKVSVIVHFNPDMDGPNRQLSAVRANLRDFVRLHGAKIKHEFEVLPNAVNIRGLPRHALGALERIPGVVKIEEDTYDLRVSLHDSTPLVRGLQSQITGAGLSATGAGIRLCVIDTGIDSDHVMYSARIDAAAGWDFANDDSNPEDDNGHGSHVSGISLGRTGLTVDFGCVGPEPFQGIAPSATLIGVKVLNAFGGGFDSDIIAGINHCASAALPGGQADVINMSLGTGAFSAICDTHSWAVAANNAVDAGVTVVVATGNECLGNATRSPGCASKVISVGATYDDNFPSCEDPTSNFNWSCCIDNTPSVDEIVCFSNGASWIDVTAPGSVIWSASTAAGGGSITAMSGTSMACPQVAGLAALVLDVNPALTPAQVETIIENGAIDKGPIGFDSDYGWGRIDVINSLQAASPSCSNNAQCDDGLFCNGAETCVSSSCQAGTAPNCSDGVACTTDTCNESTDSCDHTPNNAACDDGLFCNGAETCHVTLGCQAGTDPCAPEPCNESTNTCGSGPEVWMSFLDTTTVPVVGNVENEDIVSYNQASGTWSLIFDGSDVGLTGLTIDGMARLSDGSILLSFVDAGTVAGLTGGPSGTSVDDSDIVRFIPTSLGATTAGSFSFYFDGSDVGLTTNNEDVDAIAINSSGQLVLSTIGSFTVTGVSGEDEDLIAFSATSLGSVTAGTYTMLFDGSDVALNTAASEDVDAAAFRTSGAILLSTTGNYSVTGASGANEDIFQFTPTTLGGTTSGTFVNYLDLSTLGIATSEDVMSVDIVE